MSRSVLVPCATGEPVVVHWPQSSAASRLGGGGVTFVGGMPDLNVVIVGRAECHDCVNPACARLYRGGYLFEEHAAQRGDLLLIASDEDGRECDVDVLAVSEHLRDRGAPEKK